MSKAYFYFRLTLYSLTLLTVSFIAVAIGVICTLLGQTLNTNYYVARTFFYTAGPIMGWKFDMEGEEHLWKLEKEAGEGCEGEVGGKKRRSAVMVGNHQSFVDILWLGRIFPKEAAIMAKKSISYLPGLGWFMLMSGTVFINRSNNRSAVASMQTAGEDMKRKKISLWVFPEGTRHLSAQNDMLSFKKGAFYLAVQSGAPIVPVVIENYHRLFDGKTRFKSGTLKIKGKLNNASVVLYAYQLMNAVLPPIPTTGLTTADVPALMDKTRDLMIQTLREISAPPPISSSSSVDNAQQPLLSEQTTDYASTVNVNGNGNGHTKADESQVEHEVGDEEVRDQAESQVNGEASAPVNGTGAKKARRVGKGRLCIA